MPRPRVLLLAALLCLPACRGDAGPERTARLDTLAGFTLRAPITELRAASDGRGIVLRCRAVLEARQECEPALLRPGDRGYFTLYLTYGILTGIRRPLARADSAQTFRRFRAAVSAYGRPSSQSYDPASRFSKYRASWLSEDSLTTLWAFCPDTLSAAGCELFAYGDVGEAAEGAWLAAADEAEVPPEPEEPEATPSPQARFLEAFARAPRAYLGHGIKLERVRVRSRSGHHLFWVELPKGEAYPVRIEPALGAYLALSPGDVVSLFGRVRPLSDSLLRDWQASDPSPVRGSMLAPRAGETYLEVRGIERVRRRR